MDKVKSSIKKKERDTIMEKLYADILICDKTQETIISEMGRYNVSTNVAVTTDTK